MSITFNVAPVDVVNEALGQLGKDFITDLDDTLDPVAVKAKQYFGTMLRTMLRDHDWNFARSRVSLAQSATAPVSGYAYSYPLPGTCFFVRRLNGSDQVEWKIEGRNLFTDEATAIIEFTVWVDDPNLWDGAFHQAFVTMLAVRFAPAFHSDMKKADELYKLAIQQLWDAKAIDGQEGSQDRMECTELTEDIRE